HPHHAPAAKYKARAGAAVLVISSDLPEVLAVADRVLVMREGRIAGELARGEATESAVMELASMGLAVASSNPEPLTRPPGTLSRGERGRGEDAHEPR
ncbi:MAG: hypothetical protein WKF75_14420, partial [Singulisphaera sp.]